MVGNPNTFFLYIPHVTKHDTFSVSVVADSGFQSSFMFHVHVLSGGNNEITLNIDCMSDNFKILLMYVN